MSDTPTPDLTKVASIPPLSSGGHHPSDGEMCVMEAVAFVAGEPWSDSPACACPVIGAFLRAWNDGLPDDERDALLRPLIPRLVGTKSTPAVEHRRSLMAADWLVREHTPAWLRLAGLTAQADALAGLPEITSMAQVPSIRPAIEAARRDAAAAWDAARDAAWDAARDAAWAAAWDAAWDAARAAAWDAARAAARDAARDAAWDAARDAAWDAAWAAARDAARAAAWDAARAAARDAARDAAWDAARDAAWAAARAAAWDALNPTRIALQRSALRLVERMIEVAE
ncbi:hypothetical protein [Rhodovarius lipocyclicus]|uniref:hypothetical protein n=1 Tax=Rhodovarius lipocyclicus TaxID=268410 RepID=UPI001917755F|nr:hypothetical protein [Rhodovarius lipocyclicus]